MLALIQQAEQYQQLPFEQKLVAIKNLALGAMRNAYEIAMTSTESTEDQAKCRNLVFEIDASYSLGAALRLHRGCCRYQATLFLVLGAAAKLGQKQYLQCAQVKPGLYTCFNDIIDENGKTHHVSIFYDSLNDKSLNYSQDPTMYDHPVRHLSGYKFLAYTVQNNIVHKYSRYFQHFDS